MAPPDVRVFVEATGGRVPGLSQYRSVIETVRRLAADYEAAGMACAAADLRRLEWYGERV